MKIERQVDQIIIENVPAIAVGDELVESVLARYPKIEAELRPRLEAAILLQQVRFSVATRPGFIHDFAQVPRNKNCFHATKILLAAYIHALHASALGF